MKPFYSRFQWQSLQLLAGYLCLGCVWIILLHRVLPMSGGDTLFQMIWVEGGVLIGGGLGIVGLEQWRSRQFTKLQHLIDLTTEQTDDVFIIKDAQGRYLAQNSVAQQLLNGTGNFCPSSALTQILAWLQETEQLVIQGRTPQVIERSLRVDEQQRTYRIIVVPQFESQQGLTTIVTRIQEITDCTHWQHECDRLTHQMAQQVEELATLNRLTAGGVESINSESLPIVMLERILEATQANTAVLLVRDDNHLQVQASLGLYADVLQGAKIPIGQGFAGTIAATMRPLYLADAQAPAAPEPEVSGLSLQHPTVCTMMGVPLIYGRYLIGVIYVSWDEQEPYCDRYLKWLELVADRCTLALVNSQLYDIVQQFHQPSPHTLPFVNNLSNSVNRLQAIEFAQHIVRSPRDQTLIQELQQAIEQNQFELYYQPIITLRNNALRGFEALIRWQHPTRGLVMPDDFIPLAEKTGLILPIGYWTLQQACQQIQQWQTQFPQSMPLLVSVNLSSRQFNQPDLVNQVEQVLQTTGLSPRSLKLEITETAVMQDVKAAAAMLLQLHQKGVRLSIDDFGTGYSSLGYLYKFPLDTLKVDRSFINRIDVDGEQVELVRTVLSLAWNLGLDTIAEGVESAKQLAQLKALKCEYAQGYFFNKPLPAAEAEALIRQQSLDTLNA